MLFYGPPGTGKTSTILALLKQLYGPNLIKTRVLELNASDERGISIVRDKIKNFARLTTSNPTKEDLENYPCPPYKLIILDEADSMTSDAQSALRRTMETYSNVTRFCLVCNYITRIIDPLASRCSKFRFKLLENEQSLDRLKYVSHEEKVELDPQEEDKILREILRISNGDLRKAITFLQSASRLYSLTSLKDEDDDIEMIDPESSQHSKITIPVIREIAGMLPPAKSSSLISVIQSGNLNKINRFLTDEIFLEGFNGSVVIDTLHDKLLLGNSEDDQEEDISLRLSTTQKIAISKIIFETDFKLVNGTEESLQILNMILKISKVL